MLILDHGGRHHMTELDMIVRITLVMVILCVVVLIVTWVEMPMQR